jgi:hypothetical protein
VAALTTDNRMGQSTAGSLVACDKAQMGGGVPRGLPGGMHVVFDGVVPRAG